MKDLCPFCGYPMDECQCLSGGSAHPNPEENNKRLEVVLDHLYLFTDEQIEHIKKIQRKWQICYGNKEKNKILNDLNRENAHWEVVSQETGACDLSYKEYKCSYCGWSTSLLIPRNYCPNCGAKMRKSY